MNDADHSPEETPAGSHDPDAPIPSKGRTPRRALRVAVFSAVALAVLLVAAPTLASHLFLRSSLEDALASSLATSVTVADASLGWLDGVRIEGLRVENPDGFARDEPCVEAAAVTGDLSLIALLGGRVDLRGRVTGLDVRVVQRADGTTNLESLGRREPSPESDGPAALDGIRLDLELVDAKVDVAHEEHGRIERVTDLDARVTKPFVGSDVRIELTAALADGGHVHTLIDADATFSRPLVADLECESIDLARYRPLIDARLPDQIAALGGTLAADLRITAHPERETRIDGEVTIVAVHIAGPIVGGLDVRSEVWRIRPELTATADEIDTSSLALDLGFLRASGLDAARTAALCGGDGFGARVDVDLPALIGFGLPLPDGLAAEGLHLTGDFALRRQGEGFSLESIVRALGAEAELRADRVQWADRELESLRIATRVADGVLTAESADGAKLDGGDLRLSARVDLRQVKTAPTQASLAVRGARVGGSAVKPLRFAVPLLAGIAPEQAEVDFDSALDLELTVRGPALRAEDQDLFEWLDSLGGTGSVALRNGSFTPAPQLAGLLEVVGQRNRLAFDDLTTSFDIAAGALSTEALAFNGGGTRFELRGKTTFRGALDYSLDLSSWLRGHKDGEKVLQYVDPKTLHASLGGTLTSPSLALPDLDAIFQQAVQKALETEAKKHADKALRDLFDRLRR